MQLQMTALAHLVVLAVAVVAGVVDARPNATEWKAAQAQEAAAAKAAAAKESKMAAVGKVISMLESLQSKVLMEGEEEAQTYNKFACFCKDTTDEKSTAIQQGEDSKTTLTSEISSLSTRREELDATIQTLTQAIEDIEKAIQEAKEKRALEHKEYLKNEADLTSAVQALEGAIQSLKASKEVTLAQLQAVAKTASTAAIMADALGLGGDSAQRVASFFLQEEPTVPTEDYKFRSDSIIETLEKLLTDFRDKKVEVDNDEVTAVDEHNTFLQAQNDLIKQKTVQLDGANEEKAEKTQEIATKSQDLTTVAATLLDDQEYLRDLSKMCSDKAATWDQRSGVRADELSALVAALGILKGAVSQKTSGSTIRFAQRAVRVHVAKAVARNEAAMEALEAVAEAAEAGETPAAPLAFLQRSDRSRSSSKGPAADGRQAVITLLRSKGAALRSATLVALASELAADPFAKVKQLIQELIERLLAQASNEANQKGWCDKSIGSAKQRRDYAAEKIQELNGRMAGLEARRDQLAEELDILGDETQDLEAKRAEAVQMREQEQLQNNQTITEAQEGFEAVNSAITLLDRFYKTAAKEDVALAQRGPAEDAPDAGFEGNYTGSQGEAGGIVGMLEVVKSDFRRTVVETQKAEAQAKQDHLVFMTETGKSLAKKNTAKEEKGRQKTSAVEKLEEDEGELQSQVAIVEGTVKELLQLKEACETGMSYEERVARREDEIAALKKALCVLSNYEQYGPDAAASGC